MKWNNSNDPISVQNAAMRHHKNKEIAMNIGKRLVELNPPTETKKGKTVPVKITETLIYTVGYDYLIDELKKERTHILKELMGRD